MTDFNGPFKYRGLVSIIDANGELMAILQLDACGGKEKQIGQLFAAAPDLLATLKEAAAALPRTGRSSKNNKWYPDLLKQIHNVIAKVEKA